MEDRQMGAVIRRHTGNPWRQEEFETMELMRAHGVSWEEIAACFHSTKDRVMGSYSAWRSKKSTGHWIRREEERAEIERRVLSGEKVGDIAKVFGITVHSLGERLRRMGLDLEMRREALGITPPSPRQRNLSVAMAEPVLAEIAAEAGTTVEAIRGEDDQLALAPVRHRAIRHLHQAFPRQPSAWIGRAVRRSETYVDKVLSIAA
ncbi:hypothetical protein mvi_63370 (plasmid) [Methylobacterium indicum]|uniref:Uncharacterized protein n=2 Tax=Methylobacterium indicum TaxID=1775910 RepID=A0A8H9CA81_9HYPH|nr:hypothetical protein mvi_63370 [Methylobacterium indicum]